MLKSVRMALRFFLRNWNVAQEVNGGHDNGISSAALWNVYEINCALRNRPDTALNLDIVHDDTPVRVQTF